MNPNPFLEEPNKLNLVPVGDRRKVIPNYLGTFNILIKKALARIKNIQLLNILYQSDYVILMTNYFLSKFTLNKYNVYMV